MLKRVAEISFSPVGIMLLVLVAGILLSLAQRRKKIGHRLLLLGTFLYLTYTFSPLAELAMASLERHYPPLLRVDSATGVEQIVVLSGYGVSYPSTPITSNLSDDTICRIAEGIRLYRQLPRSRILVSGGILKKGDRPIAALMADFIAAMGVSTEDVLVEGKSRNTYENLVEVKAVVGQKPFILVTTACDLPRAMAVARKLGMKPIAAPACIWALQEFPSEMPWSEWSIKILKSFAYPSSRRLAALQWAYHEYLGYVWYKLLGRV